MTCAVHCQCMVGAQSCMCEVGLRVLCGNTCVWKVKLVILIHSMWEGS
jgi:hypothetical protein